MSHENGSNNLHAHEAALSRPTPSTVGSLGYFIQGVIDEELSQLSIRSWASTVILQKLFQLPLALWNDHETTPAI